MRSQCCTSIMSQARGSPSLYLRFLDGWISLSQDESVTDVDCNGANTCTGLWLDAISTDLVRCTHLQVYSGLWSTYTAVWNWRRYQWCLIKYLTSEMVRRVARDCQLRGSFKGSESTVLYSVVGVLWMITLVKNNCTALKIKELHSSWVNLMIHSRLEAFEKRLI